ncbi:MAG: ribbon-helix-helix protein, CopG family [Sandaracinus sp.]
MRETLTVRIDREQAEWLEQTAERTGRSIAAIVREQIDLARRAPAEKRFMRLAGAVEGDAGASQRRGFSKK